MNLRDEINEIIKDNKTIFLYIKDIKELIGKIYSIQEDYIIFGNSINKLTIPINNIIYIKKQGVRK